MPAPRGPGGRRPTTATVIYDSAHLRVRVCHGDVLWFLRDIGPAVGFRPPLTPGSALPQVLVTTAELWTVMAAAGFRPPAAFTAWAEELTNRLPRPALDPHTVRN